MSQTGDNDNFLENTAKHSWRASQLLETKKKQEIKIMCDVNVINVNITSWIQEKISWSAQNQY